MTTVKEWVKANAKDGSNFAEFEELLTAYEIPTGKDEARAFIYKNRSLLSAFDDEVRIKVEAHDAKFTETKLPEIMKQEKEKLMKELHPEETPLEKRVREQDEWIKASIKKDEDNARKDQLRKKAAEIGYDPIRAERYSAYGEDAETMLLQDHEYMTGFVKTKVEEETARRFSNKGPFGNSSDNKTTLEVLKDKYRQAEEKKDGDAMLVYKDQISAFQKG